MIKFDKSDSTSESNMENAVLMPARIIIPLGLAMAAARSMKWALNTLPLMSPASREL